MQATNTKDTIRAAVVAKFGELLPTRSVIGNTEFRRNVMNWGMREFNITLASASTHYNFALLEAKKNTPEQVEGLGRAEDRKGGRKTKDGRMTQPVAAKLFSKAEHHYANKQAEGVAEEATPAQEEPAVKMYNVRSVKKQEIVQTGLTKEAADAMCAENNAKKFVAKLEAVEA